MSASSLPTLSVLPDEFVILRFDPEPETYRLISEWLAKPACQANEGAASKAESAERPDSTGAEAETSSVERRPWHSLTQTDEELSVVIERRLGERMRRSIRLDSANVEQASPRRMLKLNGPLPLNWIGILARLAAVLAEAQISLFCQATYDTDYILVESTAFTQALEALEQAGYRCIS